MSGQFDYFDVIEISETSSDTVKCVIVPHSWVRSSAFLPKGKVIVEYPGVDQTGTSACVENAINGTHSKVFVATLKYGPGRWTAAQSWIKAYVASDSAASSSQETINDSANTAMKKNAKQLNISSIQNGSSSMTTVTKTNQLPPTLSKAKAFNLQRHAPSTSTASKNEEKGKRVRIDQIPAIINISHHEASSDAVATESAMHISTHSQNQINNPPEIIMAFQNKLQKLQREVDELKKKPTVVEQLVNNRSHEEGDTNQKKHFENELLDITKTPLHWSPDSNRKQILQNSSQVSKQSYIKMQPLDLAKIHDQINTQSASHSLESTLSQNAGYSKEQQCQNSLEQSTFVQNNQVNKKATLKNISKMLSPQSSVQISTQNATQNLGSPSNQNMINNRENSSIQNVSNMLGPQITVQRIAQCVTQNLKSPLRQYFENSDYPQHQNSMEETIAIQTNQPKKQKSNVRSSRNIQNTPNAAQISVSTVNQNIASSNDQNRQSSALKPLPVQYKQRNKIQNKKIKNVIKNPPKHKTPLKITPSQHFKRSNGFQGKPPSSQSLPNQKLMVNPVSMQHMGLISKDDLLPNVLSSSNMFDPKHVTNMNSYNSYAAQMSVSTSSQPTERSNNHQLFSVSNRIVPEEFTRDHVCWCHELISGNINILSDPAVISNKIKILKELQDQIMVASRTKE